MNATKVRADAIGQTPEIQGAISNTSTSHDHGMPETVAEPASLQLVPTT